MKNVSSSTSLSSISSMSGVSIPATTNMGQSSFEELVDKIFTCNIVLMLTDNAKQFVRQSFGTTTLVNILNQFQNINELKTTIRDLNGHNAYALNKIRFRFFDVDLLKSRPNGAQLRKSHFDVIASMSNTYHKNVEADDENDQLELMNTTPWYDLWKNIYVDTFEQSDHDFIGAYVGCFFVITKHELPRYKTIFEKLYTTLKQNTTLRFVQPDLVRYFIVLSDQVLEASTPSSDQFTKTCQNMKLEFPNSFVFYVDSSVSVGHQSNSANEAGDLSSDISSDFGSLNLTEQSSSTASDPLNAAVEQTRNSRFYENMQQQRQQTTNTKKGDNDSGSVQLQSKDIVKEWFINMNSHDQLKGILETISETIDFMLREFVTKFLIPWAERQIKVLGELITQRKSFRKSIFSATRSLISGMSSSTASLTKSVTGAAYGAAGSVATGVIYIPDAQEMQQRKLADICMIFGVYELAATLYYAARKDFQSEGAWLYYAGASEMAAVASFLSSAKRLQVNYFDQAITTYIETCRSIPLATRCAILATELLCKLNQFNDAASVYIRLTGDDSDLRSALFLEQASKCYLRVLSPPPQPEAMNCSTSPLQLSMLYHNKQDGSACTVPALYSRYRKAAFYYILAGFRYNRCGLKHFALCCYRRFNYPDWDAAGDYVNMTVAKLFLNLSSNDSKCVHYYLKGLQLHRTFSNKQQFFAEYLREIKKLSNGETRIDASGDLPQDLFELPIPKVKSYQFVSLDSIPAADCSTNYRRSHKQECYVGEEMVIALQLESPFEVNISNLRLVCDRHDNQVQLEVNAQTITLSKQSLHACLKLRALVETEFTLTGLVFQVDHIQFRTLFEPKLTERLTFKSIVSLPLIDIEIAAPQLGLDSAALASLREPEGVIHVPVSVYNTEIISLKVAVRASTITPSVLQLHTDAANGVEIVVPGVALNGSPVQVNVTMPEDREAHRVTFRLAYEVGGRTRTILRHISFRLEECFSVEMKIESVVTLKNLSSQHNFVVFDVAIDDYYDRLDASLVESEMAKKFVKINSGESVHVLMLKHFIRWSWETMLAPGVFRGGMLYFD